MARKWKNLGAGVLSVLFACQNSKALDYPAFEDFNETLNTNIWYQTNNNSASWKQTNGKLVYINAALDGDSDTLIIIQKSVSLNQSWEFSLDLHHGTNLVVNSPNTNEAFKKAGFMFGNFASNPSAFDGRYLWAGFYDYGSNSNPKFEYELFKTNGLPPAEKVTTTVQSPWRSSNSWYPQRSIITATWSSKNKTLKIKLSPNENVSNPDPKEGKTEIELVNPFHFKSESLSLTNLSLGIILKSAFQPVQATDNFALESVSFRIATNQILAFDDDDADGDGISNYDEIINLKTDPNNSTSSSSISGLYTFDYISNNPTYFGYINPDQVYDVFLGFGGLVLSKNTNSNSFTLNYNILMSTNLSTWSTNETRSYSITNTPTNKMFLRIAPVFSSPAPPLATPL